MIGKFILKMTKWQANGWQIDGKMIENGWQKMIDKWLAK